MKIKLSSAVINFAIAAATIATFYILVPVTPWQNQVEILRQESSVGHAVAKELDIPVSTVHAFRSYSSERLSLCLIEISKKDATKHFDPMPDIQDADEPDSDFLFEYKYIVQSPDFEKMQPYLPTAFRPTMIYHSPAGRMHFDPRCNIGVMWYHSYAPG